ncbi:MAG: molybdopterin biosynthesis protein [Bacillota bacterium]|nr:molybdopterin biosynthesis protein [Bacillota bacterium]MDD3298124.1 molybdopterin biosynthesis protein [Bacillota bacterium]MDD3851347.1 molybdopterin biosynthesis protein [Bacillota bacterium]MDD4706925.1 molybdopterin biosynthesis protein [Bacillota bacterium]
MKGKNVYLSSKELEQALDEYTSRLKGFFDSCKTEGIDTALSLGRVTAEPVFAIVSSPHFNASAMDGIALKANVTFGARERNRIRLSEGKDYVVVDTGDPIPSGYNAVIMSENLIEKGEGEVEISAPATPWQHIRPIGEDMVQGELIIPTFHKIRPVDIGAMLAGGVNTVRVIKKPRVAIIPTGTELVLPGEPLKEGSLIEYNSHIFTGLIEEWGGEAVRQKPIPDVYEDIKDALKRAVDESDMVLVNAGSSAGREDFTKDIIRELGEVITHGIAVKPGSPAILGIVSGKPVVGIPGYPVSAYIIMENIVKPLVCRHLNLVERCGREVEAVSSRRVVSSLKNKEFVRVKLGKVGNKLIATPLTRGAGVVMSLVRADGILAIPQSSEGVDAGETVRVRLLKDPEEIENTIVCIGSHDPILDLLANEIHHKNPRLHLASAHVGSMGGITALLKGETHIAGVHLLDGETGEYNVSYIKKYLGVGRIALIKLVDRIQGFMVKKGNPKDIRDFSDIAREGVSFVNRQKGSGTRLLLDYKLKEEKIDPATIYGYDREEFTHMAVAAAVAFSDIDVGLGVYSAASSLGLDFVPVCSEEYDLAVPVEFLKDSNIKLMLGIIRDSAFQEKIKAMGGYSLERAGEIVPVD